MAVTVTDEVTERKASAIGRALSGRVVRLLTELGSGTTTPSIPHGVTDLTVPELPVVPEHIRTAASSALARGETHYTSRFGILELREALVRELERDGFPVRTDGIVVTNGGSEGLYIVLQALLSMGDQVAIPEPVLPNVAAMIGFIGADLIRVPADPTDRFLPPVDALLASGASTILVASPSPITGVALDLASTRALIAGAAERGINLILDRSLMPAANDPALAVLGTANGVERVITIGSFSAGYGLDGWRIGYLTAPADRLARMHILKQAMSICTTAVSQFAALAALTGPRAWLDERRVATVAQRDAAIAILTAAGLPVVVPDAAQALLVDTRSIDLDDRVVAARFASEAGVIVQPGADYGPATAGFIRLAFGLTDADRLSAICRIARMTSREQAS